jgi:hypothetical protein
MPDDEIPLHERDESDERDARMAALLAVEPLDDVTRRRLVNTAIRSTGSARQARRLIAAAAVVLVLVAGAGVVVAVGGGNDASQNAFQDAGEKLGPRSTPYTIGTDARDIGNFGDLGVAANVDRLRGAFDATGGSASANVAPRGTSAGAPAAAGTGADSAQSAPAKSDALVARLRALGCSASALPTGTVVALASGTLDGHPVIVVDLQSSTGTHSFHAIETDTCKVHRLS